jgi:hypothetical protein
METNSMEKKSVEKEKILTRIYVQENGNLLVTDMWEEVRDLLLNSEEQNFEEDN